MTTATQKASAGQTDALLKKYATPLTAILAVVVSVTGIMMFYRVYKSDVETMHEWLGMAFVVAAILHMVRHRRPLLLMLTKSRTRILALFAALIAAAFIGFPPQKEGNPFKQIVSIILRAPINDLAPVLGISSEEAIFRLVEAGVQNATPAQSIDALAQASDTKPLKLLFAIIKPSKEKPDD